ncbi:Leucine-rich repeat protein kinase family protein [Rhynchospora pubera]|uniref:non-specific serine/threonine protein kinase n=1 Tax=Rhynchospora pubera TaxID=906938 RepID=A0AAV8EY09_9POAL|nr:Leucine-rich repeat protein kinase family protein [Rhynchospora pubera]
MYYSEFERQYLMFMVARINFGALSNASVRYPDDPFDRIWESDSSRSANYQLVDVSPGTQKVATTKPVYVSWDEEPPMKVMQTAVVGNNGTLSYTIYLANNNFQRHASAYLYFAEIEDLNPNETRQFGARFPWGPTHLEVPVNVMENAGGKYRLYEPVFFDISLPLLTPLKFRQTNDSSRGPILNAFEIFKYNLINFGSLDSTAMDSLVSIYPQKEWAQEGGDPCSPIPWTWVQCNSDSQPRIISLKLSGKNLTGNIPQQLTNISGLVELHLDGNSLRGVIPDFSGLRNIQIIHLENNALTGSLPLSLANLPKLKQLYVQNNNLSGEIPVGLLRKNIIFFYAGNPGLHLPSKEASNNLVIILSVIGAVLMLIFIAAFYFYKRKQKENKRGKFGNSPTGQSKLLRELDAESTYRFELSEITVATKNFEKVIGKGGFGTVYYGKLSDRTEIAVKVHDIKSKQGIDEFLNEVALLSRIHHRNLVKFLGYSQEEDTNILVYEFMNEGTLTEHLRGPPEKKIVSWLQRMEIAEDTAKGIEYLHKGCSPAIIHRDLKTSNILLDQNMRAKVSDFGLSKLMPDGSHISTMVKGTIGYLDPEYYVTQRFTEKSDVYSFGIILLELISGYNPISSENFGDSCEYIVSWARGLVESGDIEIIADKSLEPTYDIESVRKMTKIALMCVKPSRLERPSISEVLKEIQAAIKIEQKALTGSVESTDLFAREDMGYPPNFDVSYSTSSECTDSYAESFIQPGLTKFNIN